MADQPTEESQDQPPKESDPAVEALRKEMQQQQQKFEQLTNTLSQKDREYSEAVRRMHEATQEAAALKKAQAVELTEEEAAKLLDDPIKLAKWTQSIVADATRSVEEKNRADLESAMSDVASYLSKKEAEEATRFKQVDPRFNSDSFREAKEKYGDAFTDEQILTIIEKDGGSRAPSAPTGSSAVPARKQEETDIRDTPMFKAVFGRTLESLGEKK